MTLDLRKLNERASRQHGLVTRGDLRTLGLSDRQRRTLVAQGVLERVGRQTFAAVGAPSSAIQRVMAACLDADGFATVGSGAWMHDIGRFGPGAPPAVIVHRPRFDYRLPIAEIHSTSWLPSEDVTVIDGVSCLSVARTLFSLAAAVPIVPLDSVIDAVDEAVRDGKASDRWLWWMLERTRRRGRNGVSTFEAILRCRSDGQATESWLEREFLKILADAGVTLPLCQQRIDHDGSFVGRVDFLDEAYLIVIEVSGHAHHSSRSQLAADAHRRNQLQLAGYRVLEFTFDQVVKQPQEVVGQVIAARDAAIRLPARGGDTGPQRGGSS